MCIRDRSFSVSFINLSKSLSYSESCITLYFSNSLSANSFAIADVYKRQHLVYPRFIRTVPPRGVINGKMHPNEAYDIIHNNDIRDEQIIEDIKNLSLIHI